MYEQRRGTMAPKKKQEDQKMEPEVTVHDLLKAIHKECLGCCGQKKDKVEHCDCITCPLYRYRMLALST